MDDRCPAGGGVKNSSGSIRTDFVALNQHAQGKARPYGALQLGQNKCAFPSFYTWIGSEAVLRYYLDRVPDSFRGRSNLYFALTVTLHGVFRKGDWVLDITRKATEYFRLDSHGVAVVPDNQLLTQPFQLFCEAQITCSGSLRVVQVTMLPGVDLPAFMSDPGTVETSEGYQGGAQTESKTATRPSRDDAGSPPHKEGVKDIESQPGLNATGNYVWSTVVSHCGSSNYAIPTWNKPDPNPPPRNPGIPSGRSGRGVATLGDRLNVLDSTAEMKPVPSDSSGTRLIASNGGLTPVTHARHAVPAQDVERRGTHRTAPSPGDEDTAVERIRVHDRVE